MLETLIWGQYLPFPSPWGGARTLYRKQVPNGKLRFFFASRLALKIIFILEKKKFTILQKKQKQQVNNKIEKNILIRKLKKK